MTRENFLQLQEADVCFQGKAYYLPKERGEDSCPLCTRTQYRMGRESFAHIFPTGEITRYREVIGTIADLTLINDRHPVAVDYVQAFDNLTNPDAWPGLKWTNSP